MVVEKLFIYHSKNQSDITENFKLENKCLEEETKDEEKLILNEKMSINNLNENKVIDEEDDTKDINCHINSKDNKDNIEGLGKAFEGLQLSDESASSEDEENDLCPRGPIKYEKSFTKHSYKPYDLLNTPDDSPERLYTSSPEFATDKTDFSSPLSINSNVPDNFYDNNSMQNFDNLWNFCHSPLSEYNNFDDIQYPNQLSASSSSDNSQDGILNNNSIHKKSPHTEQIQIKNDLDKLLDQVDDKFQDIQFVKEMLNKIEKKYPHGVGLVETNYLPQTVQEVNEKADNQGNYFDSLFSKNLEVFTENDNITNVPKLLEDICYTTNISHLNKEYGHKEIFPPNIILINSSSPIKMNYQKKILPNGEETHPCPTLCYLNKKMNANIYKKARIALNKYPIEKLTKGDDKDNDTELMVALCGKNIRNKLEYVIALINHIHDKPDALEHENNQGLDALFHACFYMTEEPLVASYITEILAKRRMYVGSIAKCSKKGKYEKGDTLIHIIARRGDDYADLLANLLLFQKKDGTPFNLEARNDDDETPLYVAVKVHGENKIRSIRIVEQLVLKNAKKYCENKCPMQLALQKDPMLFNAITKYDNYDFNNDLN